MRTAQDSNGERLFDSTEFLTSQQIASFFSRLASKRSLNDVAEAQSDEDEEQNEADRESQLQVLRNQVMSDISIQQVHPIVYDTHNIFELIKNSNLLTFSMKMLQDICSLFSLDVSKITIKRKKPYNQWSSLIYLRLVVEKMCLSIAHPGVLNLQKLWNAQSFLQIFLLFKF